MTSQHMEHSWLSPIVQNYKSKAKNMADCCGHHGCHVLIIVHHHRLLHSMGGCWSCLSLPCLLLLHCIQALSLETNAQKIKVDCCVQSLHHLFSLCTSHAMMMGVITIVAIVSLLSLQDCFVIIISLWSSHCMLTLRLMRIPPLQIPSLLWFDSLHNEGSNCNDSFLMALVWVPMQHHQKTCAQAFPFWKEEHLKTPSIWPLLLQVFCSKALVPSWHKMSLSWGISLTQECRAVITVCYLCQEGAQKMKVDELINEEE